MRQFPLLQNPRHQALTGLLNLSVLSLLVGSIDLGMILPVYADNSNSRMAEPEASDPTILVKELARLEAQIRAHAKLVTLEEAISTGIRSNPQLMGAGSGLGGGFAKMC